MLYDSVYIKGPEKANLWIRKAHEWLPGVGAGVGDGQGVTANGHKGGLFRGGWNCFKTRWRVLHNLVNLLKITGLYT